MAEVTGEIAELVQKAKEGSITKGKLYQELLRIRRGQVDGGSAPYQPEPQSSPFDDSSKAVSAPVEKRGGSGQFTVAPEDAFESGEARPEVDESFQSFSSAKLHFPAKELVNTDRARGRQVMAHVKHLEEFTFKPKISAQVTPGEAESFQKRVLSWCDKRDKLLEQRRTELLEQELEECTFRPKISEKSVLAAQKKRAPGSSSIPVTERLYREFETLRKKQPRVVPTAREKEDMKECTFHPKVNPRRGDGSTVPSRVKRRPEEPPAEPVECTFAPEINPIGSDMPTAQAYVKKNVFQRLATPRAKLEEEMPVEEEEDDGPVLDMKAFVARLNDKKQRGSQTPMARRRGVMVAKGRPQSARASRRRQSGVGVGGERPLSAEEKKEKQRSFQAFLTRQSQHIKRKEQKTEAIKQKQASDRTPTVLPHSEKLLQNKPGSFLQRMEKLALSRQKKRRARAAADRDEECTFQPKICPKSKNIRGRTVEELSNGDLVKRQTSLRTKKLLAEQEELSQATFAPKLNARTKHVEGRLKVSSDPDSYLERMQKQAKLFSDRRRMALQHQESAEFAECTFQPRIHDAPAYVKRIAQSIKMMRDAKPPKKKDERPQWR